VKYYYSLNELFSFGIDVFYFCEDKAQFSDAITAVSVSHDPAESINFFF